MILPIQIENGVYRGPSPVTLADFKTLKQYGIKYILDLEIGPEFFGDNSPLSESFLADGFGMQIFPHPLGQVLPPTKDELRKANALIDLKRPIYVHCHKGADRTGMVIAYRKIAKGVPRDAAVNDMFAHGMSWWLWWWSLWL